MSKPVPVHRSGGEPPSPAATAISKVDAELQGLAAAIAQAVRIGRQQAVDAQQRIVTTAKWLEIDQVKKTKSYKGMRWVVGDNLLAIGTWKEFVELVLGMDLTAVDRDLSNLNSLGSEMFDSLKQLGMGYRQMRELRAIPVESRDRVLDVARTGDVDALRDAVDDLVERHAREKAELEAAARTAAEKHERDMEAARKVSAVRKQQLDAHREAEEQRLAADPAEQARRQIDELNAAMSIASAGLSRLVRAVDDCIANAAQRHVAGEARRALDNVLYQFVVEASNFHFKLDLTGIETPAHIKRHHDMAAQISSDSSQGR